MTIESNRPSHCETCGNELPAAPGIPLVTFDNEVRPVHAILSHDPLAQSCDNCNSPYKAFSGFIFMHAPLRHAIIYLPAELQEQSEGLRANAIPQEHIDKIETFDNVPDAQRAIRAVLLRSTNEVFAPLQEAFTTNTEENWAQNIEPRLQRYHYTSAFVIAPYSGEQSGALSRDELRKHMQFLLFQSVFMRLIRTVSSALEEERDPFADLDKALNPQIIKGDMEERLMELLHSERSNHLVVRIICLTLVWASHRTGELLLPDISLLWCSLVFVWLTASEDDVNAIKPAIAIETLRDTISLTTFVTMLNESNEEASRTAFIQAALHHQLVDAVELMHAINSDSDIN